MCEHLQPLEDYLKTQKIPEIFRGQAWSDNCREWAYFDCVLEPESLKAKFHLPSFVTRRENTDEKHFFAKDTFNGKNIIMVFRWDVRDKDHPIWSQAFSPDNGKTWEWNWYNVSYRVQ